MAGRKKTAADNATTAEDGVKTEEVGNVTTEAEKTQETANTEATEGSFIYVGPSLRTGVRKNTVFTGTREEVEEYLKPTLEAYPQAKTLLIPTESLAKVKSQVNTRGTLLNKYYTDLLSLSAKR